MTYLSVNTGACLNLLLVRACLTHSTRLRACVQRRTQQRWKGLDLLLARHPARTVALIRAPFLGNGTLNYILSLSNLRATPLVLGTAVGSLPGSVLFSVLGTQVSICVLHSE